MCGILGTTKVTDQTRLILPYLAFMMEERGRDSWGMTDGYHVHKEMGYVTDSFDIPLGWTQAIVHCRMASIGAVELKNQHPFVFKTKKNETLIGIHNGTLSNHTELNRKYNRSFTCDSMHIFAHLAEEESFREIVGSASCAWYVDGVLHLGRFDSANLMLAKLETGEWLFASTEEALKKSVRAGRGVISLIQKIDMDYVYRYNEETNQFDKGEHKSFGYRSYTGSNSSSSSSSTTSQRFQSTSQRSATATEPITIPVGPTTHNDWDTCELCDCWVSSDEHPICDDCLSKFRARLMQDCDAYDAPNVTHNWLDNYARPNKQFQHNLGYD